MDFLNRTFAQIADLFKSMSVGSRISAAGLTALVVISLAYLVNSNVNGGDVYLMNGETFTAAQLNTIQGALGKANLQFDVDGGRIKIPRGRQSAYMAALADADALPKSFGQYLEKAVGATNIWMNGKQQVEMIKAAKQQELSLIVSNMKGIQAAHVVYDVQDKKGFGEKPIITASVAITPLGSAQLDDEQVHHVRNFVAGAIAGLSPENVTIADTNGRTWAGSRDGAAGPATDDPWASRKKYYDRFWEEKIRQALSYIPGVVVTANCDLDPEVMHQESAIEYDSKPITSMTKETSSIKSTKSAGPAGRPGVAAQGGINQTAAAATVAGGPETNDETTQTETTNKVGERQKKFARGSHIVRKVKVAIGVPTSYYQSIWEQRNPPAAGQQASRPDQASLDKIIADTKTELENHITVLLPEHDPEQNPFPEVAIKSFDALPTPAVAMPPFQDKALAWLNNNWSTLGLVMLALLSLQMLRSMVRSASTAMPTTTTQTAAAPQPAVTLSVVSDDSDEESSAESTRSRLKRRAFTGPSLKDELSELVKEDPEAAVSVLRAWIGNAS